MIEKKLQIINCFYPASLDPHKNHKRLFRSFNKINKMNYKNYSLVTLDPPNCQEKLGIISR